MARYSLLRCYNFLLLSLITAICLLFVYYLKLSQTTLYSFNSGAHFKNVNQHQDLSSNIMIITNFSENFISSKLNEQSKSYLTDILDVFNQFGSLDSAFSIFDHEYKGTLKKMKIKVTSSCIKLEEMMGKLRDKYEGNKTLTLLSRLKEKYEIIQQQVSLSGRHKKPALGQNEIHEIGHQYQGQGSDNNQEETIGGSGKKIQINLAAVACGQRRTQAFVMLKSAVLFSQDASLHIILFSDKDTILDVAKDLTTLKWTANALGRDITFELHLDWFPSDPKNQWKKMYTPCATQRLFFPSILPHIDSLLYLDTDIIVVSNLTELWQEFSNMGQGKMAGMAANNEPTAVGWYNTMSKIPYYGSRGLNAGVMLMNLTQMRNFRLQERAIATLLVYKEKLNLADQDILNIIFHTYSEKVFELSCSYNFNWVHCGMPPYYICLDKSGKSICFCNVTKTTGVKIVHGNGGTFNNKIHFPFLYQLYQDFLHFDLLLDSPVELIQNLKKKFSELKEKPCHPLTSELLYNNSLNYFQRIGAQKLRMFQLKE